MSLSNKVLAVTSNNSSLNYLKDSKTLHYTLSQAITCATSGSYSLYPWGAGRSKIETRIPKPFDWSIHSFGPSRFNVFFVTSLLIHRFKFPALKFAWSHNLSQVPVPSAVVDMSSVVFYTCSL